LIGESTSEILQVAIKARHRALGPFHPAFDVNQIIYDGLNKTLPDDCHHKLTGRLYVSVTRVSDGKNVLINQFNSKDDVIRVIAIILNSITV
jgi:patatin-like phospholipase domain-containing protein 2